MFLWLFTETWTSFITDQLVFEIGGWRTAQVTKSFPLYRLRPSVLTSYLKVNIGCLSRVIREKRFWSSWLIFWQLRFIIFRCLNVAGNQICWQTYYLGTTDSLGRGREGLHVLTFDFAVALKSCLELFGLSLNNNSNDRGHIYCEYNHSVYAGNCYTVHYVVRFWVREGLSTFL